MTLTQTHAQSAVAVAWGMIEDATPGDTLAVGVALDYVMDNYNAGGGCTRDEAKSLLYRYAAEKITNSAHGHIEDSLATGISLYLWSGEVKSAKSFMSGYTATDPNPYSMKVWRLVKLCSWVEGTP